MADKTIRGLFSVSETVSGKVSNYTVRYYCDDYSYFFFSSVIEPLFEEEITSRRLVVKRVEASGNLQNDNNLIILAVHTPKELLTGAANCEDGVNVFAQDLLLSSGNALTGKVLIPIIHISLLDIFRSSLLGESTPPKALPRSYPIMDSSIWNHLVFIDPNYNIFKCELYRAIRDILGYYNLGYYSLEVACEYADLNARILKGSFLTGTHAKGVSPFIFHSERRIKRESQSLLRSVKKDAKNLQWRFLLVDDKVNINNDKTGECYLTKSDGTPSGKTKTEIIIDRLTDLGFNCADPRPAPSETLLDDSINIELIYVDTIDGAIGLMRNHQFDIVLLDYLLKDDYGYRLLKEVKDKEGIRGAHGELFFMFISAFTTAVSERLTFEGLSRNKRDKWQIGEGACPTNTPELFKFRLLQLMDSRLKQTCIPDLTYNNILKEVKDIFKPVDKDRGERIESVRNRAYEAYKTILGFHYDFFMLKKDEGKSLLVNSFLEDKVHMNSLLEHLLQFIHLTAFGTVRQWPEIWEEYQYFVRSMGRAGVDDKEIGEASGYIEKHIIDLKSN